MSRDVDLILVGKSELDGIFQLDVDFCVGPNPKRRTIPDLGARDNCDKRFRFPRSWKMKPLGFQQLFLLNITTHICVCVYMFICFCVIFSFQII